ncbi:MAG: hypothetical protein H0T89_28235 [Deltaproteobacteria bacterium]|nr:hypothetical protein [Deltaproteobacteria bacterium]MDQ3299071.1 hypothetical protein [Myxococcota bacterium]
MRRLAWIVLGSLLASSCGSNSSPPAGPITAAPADAGPPADAATLDRDLPRLAERSVRLYEAVAALLQAAGEDCAAATVELRNVQQVYNEVVIANAKVLHEGRARELKAALAPFDDQFDAAAKQIVGAPTLAKCVHDHAFTKAFDELVGAPP